MSSAATVPERSPDPAELRRAVDEAAQLARVLTFTFLSVWLYLIITAAATTHRDLLVGCDVTLPVLGVGVPLHMFYAPAPLLFLVLHGNLLLHLQTLARRIDRLDAALERLGPAERASAHAAGTLPVRRVAGAPWRLAGGQPRLRRDQPSA